MYFIVGVRDVFDPDSRRNGGGASVYVHLRFAFYALYDAIFLLSKRNKMKKIYHVL